jgi:hypothetical protein
MHEHVALGVKNGVLRTTFQVAHPVKLPHELLPPVRLLQEKQ